MVLRGWRPLAAMVLGSTLALATPALAFPPLPKVKVEVPSVKDPSEAWSKAMWKVNALSQEGLNKLPGLIDSGDDAAKVKPKLDQAQAKYDEAKKYYVTVPDPKSVNEGATKYYLELEAGVTNGRLALKCLEAHKPIEKSFGEGKPVGDELIARYDKAAAEYRANAVGEQGGREADGWVKSAAEYRAMNPKVAEMKASGELKIKRAGEAKVESDAMNALDKYLDQFEKAADADMGPIADADLIDGYDAQVKIVEGFRPDVAPYYAWRKWRYGISNRWFTGGPEDIASYLGATLEAQGELGGKPFKIAESGEADHCYGMLTHWGERGGDPKVEISAIATKNVSYAHTFRVFSRGDKSRAIEGICTNQASPIEFSGKPEFAGTTQKLKYVVVSWPREALPEMFMGAINTYPIEEADPDRWVDMFMKPIPMTFFYVGKTPAIVSEAGMGGGDQAYFLDGERSMAVKKYASQAPEVLELAAKWHAPGSARDWRGDCDEGPMSGPGCVKLVKCFVGVDKTFQPKWDRANEALDKANILNVDQRRVARDKIDEQWAKAHETQCLKPIASKLEAQMQAAYTKLVDWFNQTRPAAKVDVAAKMKAWEIAVERSSGR